MPRRLTQDEAAEKVKQVEDGTYRLVSVYTKAAASIDLLHTTCGTKYKAGRAKSFFQEGSNRCPKCCQQVRGHSTKRLTEETFIKRLKDTVGSKYSYAEGFKNTKTKLWLRHESCGHKFQVTPGMFLGKKQRRCPECAKERRGSHLRSETLP